MKTCRRTKGLTVNKNNSANTMDTLPYRGWAVTTGITFTFGGVKVNNRGQVVTNAQEPIPGIYAASEMAGGPFYCRELTVIVPDAAKPVDTPNRQWGEAPQRRGAGR